MEKEIRITNELDEITALAIFVEDCQGCDLIQPWQSL